MDVIIVTGSVGTGKTTLAKKLAKSLNYTYIDVNKVINEKKLCEAFDKERDCVVVDEKKLSQVLVDLIKKSNKSLIIDSHMSYFIPKNYVDLCIVTKCEDLKVLEARLKKRGYSKNKIKENIEAEIFNVCLEEAKQASHNVLIVETSKGYTLGDIAGFIKKNIGYKSPGMKFNVGTMQFEPDLPLKNKNLTKTKVSIVWIVLLIALVILVVWMMVRAGSNFRFAPLF
ncbi:adenylate kinase family protein [Candidatus Woesearchaeota archaeon]|nr:adenylate kinase family protein [Candidatus Woesearchaeota archaeon]MBW3021790.1 adenylate kinase family protein [Candidatus Woesearchaeota archaeon]